MKVRSVRLGALLGLAFLCLLAGCDGRTAVTPSFQPKITVKPAYQHELSKLDAAISHGLALHSRQPENNLIPLDVVSIYLERARLTGNYDDYTKAESLLTSLTAGGKIPASQCLTWARLHFTLHRIQQARVALDSCPASVEPTEIASLRADIAMYSGRYNEAERTYRGLVNDPGISPNFVRLALLRKWIGAPGEAAALLEAAEKRYHGGSPTLLAWFKLQRGLIALDRGRLDEALAMYRLASDELDRWWLIDEHIAEVLKLTGKAREAKVLYQSVAERTGSPEFLDVLADMERMEGNADKAKVLRERARAIYDQRLVDFPEAGAGHALEHFFKDNKNAALALSLAQKNFDTRPYGESAIALAKARILTGKADQAVSLLATEIAKGWDTAEIWWTLAEAEKKLGHQPRAAMAKVEALKRNPQSERMYSFGPK